MKLKAIFIFCLLVLVSLSCALPFGGDKGGGAKPSSNLGDLYRSPEGGYQFNSIPGFTLDGMWGLSSMKAPGGDDETGPLVWLIGGLNSTPKTNEQYLEEFKKGVAELKYAKERKAKIGGVDALDAEFSGKIKDKNVRGRVVLAMVTPLHQFAIFCIAPVDRWGEVEQYFEPVVATVSFFTPEVDATPAPPGAGVVASPAATLGGAVQPVGELRQWAASATASSEYGNPDWAAIQATGAPNTPACGDAVTAWASVGQYTQEWLELRYAAAVQPAQVNVHQNYSPDQVTRVELIDTGGNLHTIYEASPKQVEQCPYILSINVSGADYQAVGVRISIDQSPLGIGWNEIDAVELVGASAVAAVPPASGPVSPPLAGSGAVAPFDLASWKWTTFTTAQGLPEDMIQALALGKDGTLWIATGNKGVVSYDGSAFKSYSPEEGPQVTYASAIAVAPDGAVWFAGYGLARYDGSSVKKYSDQEGLPNMAPHCMAFAPDGSLWVGSAGGYVSHFDGSKFTNYSMADGIPEEHVEGIGVAPDGSVWIGTWGGFARFDGSTWQAFKEVNGIAVGRLSKNSIVIPSNGKVYIGTSMEGTFVYDGGNWTVYRNEMGSALEGGYGWGSDVAAIAPDGAIWFGSWGTGLVRFDGSNWLHLSDKDGLVYNWVAALVIAPDGTLWIGTGKGLARLSPK